jgi:hypothetical protein
MPAGILSCCKSCVLPVAGLESANPALLGAMPLGRSCVSTRPPPTVGNSLNKDEEPSKLARRDWKSSKFTGGMKSKSVVLRDAAATGDPVLVVADGFLKFSACCVR